MTRIKINCSSPENRTTAVAERTNTMDEQKHSNNVHNIFQTTEEGTDLKLEELESVFVGEEEDDKKMERRRSAKQVIAGTVGEIGENSRRFYRFVKKHILNRKKDTQVKNINILPEGYHTTWALRSASSAASRSSVDSASSMDSTCSGGRNSGLEIVHDMENEMLQDMEDSSSVES